MKWIYMILVWLDDEFDDDDDNDEDDDDNADIYQHCSNSLPDTFMPDFHDKDAVLRMPYKTLGQTGLRISALSFGSYSQEYQSN